MRTKMADICQRWSTEIPLRTSDSTLPRYAAPPKVAGDIISSRVLMAHLGVNEPVQSTHIQTDLALLKLVGETWSTF